MVALTLLPIIILYKPVVCYVVSAEASEQVLDDKTGSEPVMEDLYTNTYRELWKEMCMLSFP